MRDKSGSDEASPPPPAEEDAEAGALDMLQTLRLKMQMMQEAQLKLATARGQAAPLRSGAEQNDAAAYRSTAQAELQSGELRALRALQTILSSGVARGAAAVREGT